MFRQKNMVRNSQMNDTKGSQDFPQARRIRHRPHLIDKSFLLLNSRQKKIPNGNKIIILSNSRKMQINKCFIIQMLNGSRTCRGQARHALYRYLV